MNDLPTYALQHARRLGQQAPDLSPTLVAQVVTVLRAGLAREAKNEALRPCPRTEVFCPYREADTAACDRCEGP